MDEKNEMEGRKMISREVIDIARVDIEVPLDKVVETIEEIERIIAKQRGVK